MDAISSTTMQRKIKDTVHIVIVSWSALAPPDVVESSQETAMTRACWTIQSKSSYLANQFDWIFCDSALVVNYYTCITGQLVPI